MNPSRQRLEEKLIYIPSGQFIKTVSLGFHVVLADLLWTRAVLYFGEHFTTDRVYRWLYDILDAVTTLDPNNTLAYRFGGNLLSLEARDVEGSIALLEKGIRNNPDEDWRLYFSLGFNYFYYLEDYEKAAIYLERASRLPGHPGYLPRLTARMYAKGEKIDTAIEFLEEIYQQHDNERVKSVIADRINILVAKRHTRLLQDSVEKYKEVHGEYPRKLEELTQFWVGRTACRARTGKELPVYPGGHYVIDPDTGMIDWISESKPQWP
jgi:tetratricopeptide (TPR) repeat protein